MVVLAWVVYNGLNVLLGLFLAIVIAAALDGPVTWMQKKGLPRIIGTLIIFIIGITIIAAIFYAILPVAISEFTNLFVNFKESTGPVFDLVKSSKALGMIGDKLNELADTLISGSTSLLHLAASLFGNVFLVVAILILSFYLTVGQDGVAVSRASARDRPLRSSSAPARAAWAEPLGAPPGAPRAGAVREHRGEVHSSSVPVTRTVSVCRSVAAAPRRH